jgi:hypothetical protein
MSRAMLTRPENHTSKFQLDEAGLCRPSIFKIAQDYETGGVLGTLLTRPN